MEKEQLDHERQKQAKRYARVRRRLMVIDLLLGGAYLLFWLISGQSAYLAEFLTSYTSNPWLVTPMFAAIFGGIYYLISLPLSYYSGYVLGHRFGLSNQSLFGWIVDQIKGLVVGSVVGLFLLEVIYAILRTYPEVWWWITAGFLLLFSVVLANLAPVLLLPLFYKFVPLEDEHKELVARLTELFERAGAKIKGVYKFDMSRRTKAANAALTGLGNTRRILLGDTLISEFSVDEIETVMAHELAHHVHKDIPLGMAFEGVLTVFGMYLAHLGINSGLKTFGFQTIGEIAGLPLLILVLGIYSLLTMPLGNAFSRWRERRADAFAVATTDKPDAYASALTRLANQNLADVDPEPWEEWLLYSHPALNKRIAMAHSYKRQLSPREMKMDG